MSRTTHEEGPSYLDHRNHIIDEAMWYADGFDDAFGHLPYKESVALIIKELSGLAAENADYMFMLSTLAENDSLERSRAHLLRTLALIVNTVRALDQQTGEYDTIMGNFNVVYKK